MKLGRIVNLPPLLGALAAFSLSFCVYRLTLQTGVYSWDSAELTLGVYTQGIVHATGYPLYLIVGRVFTLLVDGDFALRVNLLSAVLGAGTVALVYVIGMTLTKQHHLPAIAGALLYGFGHTIWAQSVVAEVYTLHTFLIASVLLTLIRWELTHRERYIWLVYGALGLALANHMAALLVSMGVVPYLLLQPTRWQSRFGGLVVMVFFAAACYVYLPVRFAANPQFNLVAQYFDRDLRQISDLVWMISGQMFGWEMFGYSIVGWIGEIGRFFGQLWINFFGAGVVLGLLGVGRLYRQHPRLTTMLVLVWFAQVLFFTGYEVIDKWTMFHTAFLIFAVFIPVGVVRITRQVTVYSQRIMSGAVVVLVVAQLTVNGGLISTTNSTFVSEYTQSLMASLPDNALLIGAWTALRPVEYFQLVYARRKDIQLLDVTLLALGVRDRLHTNDGDSIRWHVGQVVRDHIARSAGTAFSVGVPTYPLTGYQHIQIAPNLFQIVPLWDTSTAPS